MIARTPVGHTRPRTSPTHQQRKRSGHCTPLLRTQRYRVSLSATRRQLCVASPAASLAAAVASESSASEAPLVLDAHLHVWPAVQDYPYVAGQEPPLAGSAEYLISCMNEAGVHGALIVQPINLQFDHSYLSSVIKAYPGRFVGCCLADPAPGGGGAQKLHQLLAEEGYRAVRFNPYLWPEGEPMTNEVGKAMFAKAGEFGAYVGFMCFKGLNLHLEDVRALCKEFPQTPVLMDHFGFCKGVTDPNFKGLISLAEFPQVVVKVSAQFRVALDPTWPYMSTGAQVRQLLAAFGVERLVWGSDFPFVTQECGYLQASKILDNCGAELSITEQEAIMGRNLNRMFPKGFA